MATLVVYRGDTLVTRVELGQQDIRIGRAQDNDLALEDPGKAVSRFHAELRHENGQYILLDLNSQNGVWIDGRRIQREALNDGSAATVGPYRLVVEGLAAQGSPGAAQAPQPAAQRTSDTIVAGQRRPPAADVRPSPSASRRPPVKASNRAGTAAPAPGFIGWLLQLPRPVLFGGFGGVMLLIIIAGQIFRRSPSAPPPVTSTTADTGAPQPATPGNTDLIAEHLTAGKLALQEHRPADAVEQFNQVLLIDKEHAEALELKAKAEEAVRQASSAAAQAPVPPRLPKATTPAPVSAPAEKASAPAEKMSAPDKAKPVPAVQTANTGGTVPPRPQPAGGRRGGREQAQAQYASAKAALDRGDWAEAQRQLTVLIKDDPGFLDAATLLERAREVEIQAQRQQAAQVVAEAKKLDASSEWKPAIEAYQRALKLDPSLDATVSAAIGQIRQKMRQAGEDAFKRARQYDAVGRAPEALALYERAVQLLAEDHPSRATAQDRAATLRAAIR